MIRKLTATFLLLFSLMTATAVAAPQVTVIGDSYSFDMQGSVYSSGRTLSQAFAAKGWNAYVSGRGGRGIKGTITPTGYQQAVKDQDIIRRSQAVVIELGTNTSMDGANFASNAGALLKLIRGYNPTARIYWVTPANFTPTTTYQAALARNRTTIIGLAGVTKIRWDAIATKSMFYAADYWKHPRVINPATGRSYGYTALEDLIVRSVAG